MYEKYNLRKVINASGKMTILGVSRVSESVKQAQKFGGDNFFVMEELVAHLGSYLAEKLAVEDVQIVSSASAGIAQSVAGLIGRGSMYHVYHPYSDKITKREIILPKGHNVDYGTPVEVMVQQGGGQVVEAGYANMCSKDHIRAMISENTCAVLYIKSHHCVQKSMLSVQEAVEVAHEANLPLIVDAAAEEDLYKYSKMGADLVIYSGAKAIEGPSSGLVIGKKKYINWVRLQSKGIGRAMKIGKDNLLGLAQAVEDYLENGSESGTSMQQRLEPFIAQLNEIDGLTASVVQDGAGRDIYRAKVLFTPTSLAKEVAEKMKHQNPAIYTREYQKNNGILEFDIRAVNADEMQEIVAGIKEIMEAK